MSFASTLLRVNVACISSIAWLAGMLALEGAVKVGDAFVYRGVNFLTEDGRSYTLARTYDAANRDASQTFADDKVMQWIYDARNLVTGATYEGDNVLTQAHDAGYRIASQSFGYGLTRAVAYGRQDNLRTQDAVAGVPELDHHYTYSPDKQVTGEQCARIGSIVDEGEAVACRVRSSMTRRLNQTALAGNLQDASFTAAYDEGNRVVNWQRPDGPDLGARESQTWNFDDAGNWTATTIDGDTQDREHNASDQLTKVGYDTLSYDTKGNLTEDHKNQEFEFDIDNRIYEVDGPAYSKIEYQYDAFGRRVYRRQGTEEEILLWWGKEEQSEHKSTALQRTIQNDLLSNPNRALNTTFGRAVEGDKDEIQYFHKNYLDHVYAVTDKDGEVMEQYRYTAFGEPEVYNEFGEKISASSIDNDILWDVKRYDAESGIYMYMYRHYHAVLGKWSGRDPTAESGGVNLYCFTRNDSVNHWGLLGLKSTIVRDGQSRAWACASDQSDTWLQLSMIVGLDYEDREEWVTYYTKKLKIGKKYRVPNTIISWIDNSIGLEFGFAGKTYIANGWGPKAIDVLQMESDGYCVDLISNAASTKKSTYFSSKGMNHFYFMFILKAASNIKSLYGVYLDTHSTDKMFYVDGLYVDYDTISSSLRYKMGWGYFMSCDCDHTKSKHVRDMFSAFPYFLSTVSGGCYGIIHGTYQPGATGEEVRKGAPKE